MELRNLVRDDREAGLFRVHRSVMRAPEILALEQERIFGRCWLYLGHEWEIPAAGDFRRRSVAGRPLIFVRGSDGAVRVFLNSCTHRGARVCRQDQGNAKTFQCFYHAWTFDNQGALVGIPGEDAYGPAFDTAERALRAPPRVDHYRGFYFVSFSREGDDLASFLGGAREYIDLVVDQAETGLRVIPGENRYAIRANWKLLSENSFDAYHVLALHQTYYAFLASLGVDVTGARGWTAAEAQAYDLGNGHAVTDTPARMPRPVALWHPCFGEAAREPIERLRARLVERHGAQRALRMTDSVRNLFIYPNVFLIDGPTVTLRVYWPTAPDYMEVTAWALGPADEAPELLANRLTAYQLFLGPGGFGTPDDVEVLEACQEGFAASEQDWSDVSRGMCREGGRLFTDELHLRAFWREWHAHVQGLAHGDHSEGPGRDVAAASVAGARP
jgi:p-cumate 2,3-dioxygenase alpha subunit